MNSYSFLAIGKTHEVKESADSKRYIGVASSYVVAVNPTKKELEAIYGHEIANEPVYVKEDAKVPTVRIDFIVKTDPELNNGIEVINHASMLLTNEPAYNTDKTKVQVIDEYGNSTWALVEDAKMNKKIQHNGHDAKIAPNYRMACRGEADLVDFLHNYLGVEDAFNYTNDSWALKDGNLDDYKFSLEHIKDYFRGDVSELKEALTLQPNNKIKLLYGIRTTENGQYQSVCTRNGMTLRNNATSKGLARLEKQVAAMNSTNTEYKVCPLQEYVQEATNLNTPVESASAGSESEMPWD